MSSVPLEPEAFDCVACSYSVTGRNWATGKIINGVIIRAKFETKVSIGKSIVSAVTLS